MKRDDLRSTRLSPLEAGPEHENLIQDILNAAPTYFLKIDGVPDAGNAKNVLDEKYQGRGLGTLSYGLLEQFVAPFEMRSIRLGVNDTNTAGLAFWPKLGFSPNGRTRLNQGVKVISTVIVMEKLL
mgnify:CR=1 FL=1